MSMRSRLPMIRLLALVGAAAVALSASTRAGAGDDPAGPEAVFQIELDRGEDLGRNLGTVFELRDDRGRPILGAGFLGAYNTAHRSDRHALHVFEGNDAPAVFEAIPRVSDDAGVYLFERRGRVYAQSAADGKDRRIKVFDETANAWTPAEGVNPDAIDVADGVLEVVGSSIRYKDRELLNWPDDQGNPLLRYYGNGWLIVWNRFEAEDPRVEQFLAWRWSPSGEEPLAMDDAIARPLSKKGEFPYAIGCLRDDLIATTNLGTILRLRDGRWETLREPDGTSCQIYAALNHGDSLWLGHYPSGEVLEYDGETIQSRPGWPPVPAGVSTGARELQTLTLYGGDVYAGVWPWGELWRVSTPENWELVRRMFTQPALTAETTHPHERETIAAGGPVLNQWGQRVTSMVHSGADLFISTSAKSSRPWSPEFGFLDEAARDEYGRVHRMKRPGHVAAPLRWTDGPTKIRVVLEPDSIVVYQDDRLAGRARRADPKDRPAVDAPRAFRLVTGEGLYGRSQSRSVRVTSEWP